MKPYLLGAATFMAAITLPVSGYAQNWTPVAPQVSQAYPPASATYGGQEPLYTGTVAARPQAQPAPRSQYGGGFIEFLMGGDGQPMPARQSAVPHVIPAQPYYAEPPQRSRAPQTAYAAPSAVMPARVMDPKFLPTTVAYDGKHRPGTIVIDTSAKFLYLVEEGGQARRYGIGVGRPGFEWRGAKTITRKAEWPDWRPPAEMLKRRPDLPRFMAGGPDNPLGARAMYLGSSLYRIHGSNEPHTIGTAVSSGCFRMRNEDVTDLYSRVKVGTPVIVM